MKIVWAGPYCGQSAIARFSLQVVNALRELGHEVAIYRTETGEAASYPALPDTTVLPSGSAMEDEWLRTADLVFANVGDHYGFHGGIFELARKRQFIGIMHDWFVLNLFWGMLRVEGRQQDAPRIIQGLYGQEAGELCAAATSETIMQVAATHFPMTEWAVADMLGCIIHSEFYRAKVQARCPGPVHKLSLAYPAPDVRQDLRSAVDDHSRLRLCTLGVVNPNKCVDKVVRALMRDPGLAARTEYRVLGGVSEQERKRLEGICAEVGFRGLVLEGRVSDERLLEGMAEADAICCLRDPALEGASASAIEGMQSGVPVIVSDAGFYADLPDDYVLKVPQGDCEDELLARLQLVDRERSAGRDMGARARAWARDEFSAIHYAKGLDALIPEFIESEPYIAAARALGRELGRMGIPGSSPSAGRLAGMLDRMFSL
ncbi:glycosyltransferase family 4 protein [Stenotrophomonas maltophilia]|uniref:Glycosyltransferase family 4 protein n=2 Tax=Bacteria TaxID=2 RepID=A0ABY7Y2J0_9GAMM|nr:glycosyltransferase family 4 protein [Stenotrophomonas sp. DFS-20110405]ALA81070.1 glyscosyl transferase [Stenotrophomonas maltophilia]MBH1477538.1 glycosyltransferase family 4 protein [Stenotrophomonas maltophilia]MBH1502608.1 glycosyltransferase family 4 protein [Stenotrophomonas maltophilia]MBH1787469.1 glycosyltransferase family 4 protein [Stenotrophomonas maltophilia]WDM64191.1 glycosyltransferase family 4 protein [Stenotrophomonas sp. DFS-20110405]